MFWREQETIQKKKRDRERGREKEPRQPMEFFQRQAFRS